MSIFRYCTDETECLTPKLNMTLKQYIYTCIYVYVYLEFRLINIYHCSDGTLLLYYNKDETEFLAPKLKISHCSKHNSWRGFNIFK